MSLGVSVVIPAYNEGEAIIPVLERIVEAVESEVEVIVVVDFPEDTTVSGVQGFSTRDARLRVVVNTYGRGPASAIRYGVDQRPRAGRGDLAQDQGRRPVDPGPRPGLPVRRAEACARRAEEPARARLRVPDVRKSQRVLGFVCTTTLDEMLDEVIPWVTQAVQDGRL